VVVLPLPVGPQITTNPLAACANPRSDAAIAAGIPRHSRLGTRARTSRRRTTSFSPRIVGIDETRASTERPLRPARKPPSCGSRRSDMSMPASSLTRTKTCAKSVPEAVRTVRSTPSTRSRTRPPFGAGSMWMSEAPEASAASKISSTARIAGASS
jgi:hypothetical protein